MYRLSKFFITYTLIVSFASMVTVGILWISNEITHFNNEAETQKENYISEKKDYIRNEVLRVVDYVESRRDEADRISRDSVQSRVEEAYAVARNLYDNYSDGTNTEEMRGMIREVLRPIQFNHGRGYFFATAFDGTELLFADRPEMEGMNMLDFRDPEGRYVKRNMISIARSTGEGFYEYKWTKPGTTGNNHRKIAYIKAIPELQMLIGAGVYPEDVEADIQIEVKNYLATIEIEDAGYIFGSTFRGVSILGPQVGRNMFDIRDTNGKYIVRSLIAAAANGGGFVEYVMPEFEGAEPVPKLSYVAPIPGWDWYLGFGLYTYQIDDEIAAGKKQLQNRIVTKMLTIAAVLFAASLVSLLLSRLFSSRLQKDYSVFYDFYKKSVFENKKINIDSLYIEDFHEIARLANEMVEKKQLVDTELQERLEERSVLLREIHHRVKNNFQAIASLFSLQAMETDDPKFHDFINEAVNRLFSMSAVHDLLYHNDDFSRVDFKNYIEMIIENVFKTTQVMDRSITKKLRLPKLTLSIEQAVPLGMIINELLTNSCKYAFPEGTEGEITVAMRDDESNVVLEYQDNGKGLPEDVDLENNHGFGYQIIKILLVQLNAGCELIRGSGYHCRIYMPKKNGKAAPDHYTDREPD